jgi:type VI secretion system secreted protein VgrG
MADWSRATALMAMTSSLGTDALIPTHLVAREEISQPFHYEITAVSQIGVIDPNNILNLPVCLIHQEDGAAVRYFHGIVQQIRSNGIQRGKTVADAFQNYTLTVVPRLWFLKQTIDCRVYQSKTAQDIITAMFGDAGLTDFTFSVTTPATRIYTVQFNESDYDFALRLMEEEGWFYYFVHTASKHTLTITDKNTTFTAANATLHFSVNENDAGGIQRWRPPVHTATGSFAMGDYDPENPGTKLYNQQTTVLKAGGATTRDVYRWPAMTFTADIVEARAKFAMEAAEAATALFHGVSYFGAMVPGGKFTLTNAPASTDDGTYALRAVHHTIEDSTWISNDGTTSYRNEFEAFLATVNWRQPLVTPRPRMDGVYSALVLGPTTGSGAKIQMQNGEEIYTDDLARVKVRFYWDWRAEATGSLSVWARVIQPWAGNGWGAQFTPRVGTEVAVAFVDGDPDRPIVVGGLYNGVSAPIYSKTDATKLGFRTRSSLKGSTSQFSELTFDDKSGSELIFIHAEKDLTTEVEHDESLTVDNCRVVLVKVDETITVKGKQTITITKDHTFEVTDGNFKSTIDKGNSSFTVSVGTHDTKIAGNSTFTVTQGNHDAKISLGNSTHTVSVGNHDQKVSLGNITVTATAGTIAVTAGQSLTLKVGANSIVIDNTGITIKAMVVSIQGQIQAELKAPMTTVSGDGMLTLKGGVTMIN